MADFDITSEGMLKILTENLSPEEIDKIMRVYETSPEHLFAWMKFTRPKGGWKTERDMASWVLFCVREISKTEGTQ